MMFQRDDGTLEMVVEDFEYDTLIGGGDRIWAAAAYGGVGWSRICRGAER